MSRLSPCLIRSTGHGQATSGGMTTRRVLGSRFFHAILLSAISLGCGSRGEADTGVPARTEAKTEKPQISREPDVEGEACLGVTDQGIWADLDDKVQITLPAKLSKDRVTARVDAARKLLVLSIDGFPRKSYPLGGASKLTLGARTLQVRPGDANYTSAQAFRQFGHGLFSLGAGHGAVA